MYVAGEFRSDRCVVKHVIDKGLLTNVEGYVQGLRIDICLSEL